MSGRGNGDCMPLISLTAASALLAVLLDALEQQRTKALQVSTGTGMLQFCSRYASSEFAPTIQFMRHQGRSCYSWLSLSDTAHALSLQPSCLG